MRSLNEIATNSFRLGKVSEIEAQMISFAQKFNRRTAVFFEFQPARGKTRIIG